MNEHLANQPGGNPHNAEQLYQQTYRVTLSTIISLVTYVASIIAQFGPEISQEETSFRR